jgi:hypothetical protein
VNKQEALIKYKKKKNISDYSDADKYIWINNNDKDLHPIRIPIPDPPDWKYIDGFGEKKEDQVFKIQEKPRRLDKLESKIYNQLTHKFSKTQILKEYPKAMWDYLNDYQEEYVEELEWIKRQWYYRLCGYWFFCNGKPTYVTGSNWTYLNYCKLKGKGIPDYRDRDRKWFLALEYFKTDTTIPATDEKGKLLYNDDGSIKLIDVGYRTIYGVNFQKPRRVGDTSKSVFDDVNSYTRNKEFRVGLQADSDNTAKKVFQNQFVYPFRYFPFYFLPMPKNKIDNVTSVKLEQFVDGGIGGEADYATTADRMYYDSEYLDIYTGDEVGKVESESIEARTDVVKTCLTEGSVLRGFAKYTTTVDEMTKNSGKQFFKFCQKSHYEKRDANGFTISGFVNVFFPAEEGHEGFIGIYGESIILDPTPEQLKHMRKKIKSRDGKRYIGCREYLENRRLALLEAGEEIKLAEEKRQRPRSYRECFTPPPSAVLWNINKLEKQLQEIRFGNIQKPRRGNFVWSDKFGGDVLFVDDESGRFYVSHFPDEAIRNKKVYRNGVYYPSNADKYIASADAYRHEKTEDGRQSDGGGCVRWLRDYDIDPEDTDERYISSQLPVCTYRYKPQTRDEYAEDMLKMTLFFSAMMYPENNIPLIIDKFKDWGYRGYLLYDTDPLTGKRKANPGFHTGNNKPEMFGLAADDIQKNCHRWTHEDIIMECLDIRSMDDMTHFDLFAAYAGTLMAEKSKYNKRIAKINNYKVDLGVFKFPESMISMIK